MQRRSFFATSAGLVSGVAVSSFSPSTGRAGEFTGVIKKGVKFHMVDEPALSIEDRFRLIADAGFDGTELRTAEKENLSEYTSAVEKTGLPVHGIVNSSNPDLATAVAFASDVGASSVLYVAPYDRKKPLMESWNHNLAVIRTGLPAAEKHEVKILVENVWASFLISALDMERFVDEVDHPWFGAYYDVGNNVRWGVPQHWIEILGDRIGKLDIKEWDEKRHRDEGLRAGFGSELGEGTIDWAAVRAWATAEVRGGDRKRIADIARRMDEVLDL